MLFGRRQELERLEHLLAGAAGGRGGACVLFGEPGIGKTRLAGAAAEQARARGFLVSWGRASETGGSSAFWPWIELLAPFSAAPTALAGARGALQAEGIHADRQRERLELFAGVVSCLLEASRNTPLWLSFDDLHAADIASLELLAFALPRTRMAPIAWVLTARDTEARAPAIADVVSRVVAEADVVPLGALSAADVERAVASVLAKADPELPSALLELTQGNPLFLLETLHAVAARSDAVSLPELRRIAVSGGVLALIRGRLSGASQALRELLELAAVLGREVHAPLLVAISGRPVLEVEQELCAAAERGILLCQSREQWRFMHVLVREAFYATLSTERRVALHAAAAGALERAAHADLAAQTHHALCALPLGDVSEAARLARRAAEHARLRLAADEAVVILSRALEVCSGFGLPDREHAELQLALGWATTEAGHVSRGRELFRCVSQAGRQLGDPGLLARAALGQGGVYVFGEVREELIATLEEALTALGSAAAVEHVRLRARLLARLAAASQPSRMTSEQPAQLARRALAMVADDTDIQTRMDVDVAAGAALSAFVPPAERIALNERLLHNARRIGDRVLELRALTRLACDYLESGDPVAAESIGTTRTALGDALSQPRLRWQSPLIRSMLAMPEGRFDECETLIAEARRLTATEDDAAAERCIEVHRFCMLLLAGRSQELGAQRAAALRVVGGLPDAQGRRALIEGVTAARTGARARARTELRAIGIASSKWSPFWRATAAEAAVCCGARDVYEPLFESFVSDANPHVCSGPFAFACAPPLAYFKGVMAFALGDSAQGAAQCERALELSLRASAKAHVAWIELAFGEGLGDQLDARVHLELALELGRSLGMPDVASRATAALERGVRPASHALGVAPVIRASPDGREWSVVHAGRELRLKSIRGLPMLRRLLENPDQEIHALELAVEAAPGAEPPAFDAGDAGPMLDASARRAYRARLRELRTSLSDAEDARDSERAERLRSELEVLTAELARAVGLGARERRAGSAAERARILVQRRVREAIRKIERHDPDLGRHLSWTIRTGYYCAYEPLGPKAR